MPNKKDTELERLKKIFPYADPIELDKVELDADVQEIKNQMIAQYVTPYDLGTLPGYVLKTLIEASNDPVKRFDKLKLAWLQVRTDHLALIAQHKIRSNNEEANTSKPMSEETKAYLREIQKSKKDKDIGFVAEPTPKVAKLPVFRDESKQAELILKYPWAIAGSFKQDPDKAMGTVLDIKCQKCGANRHIHLADLFQVKLCLVCKTMK